MIRPKQKLSLLSSSGEDTPNQGKDVSIMTILRDIVKAHPDATEELAQSIHDYMADMVYRSVSKGEILVFADIFTFIPGHLDLGPEDFPPDDKTVHVRVDLEQPEIPGVDPGRLVIPDPQGRPM
jgi:hypothetical protein